jgi:hypothetical protein
MPVAGRLGAQHGVTARGPRSSSGGLGRRGGGTGEKRGFGMPIRQRLGTGSSSPRAYSGAGDSVTHFNTEER